MPLPITSLKDYPCKIPGYSTGTFKTTESEMYENDSCKWRKFGSYCSPPVVGEVNPVKEFCFAMGIRRSARLISGIITGVGFGEWKEAGKC